MGRGNVCAAAIFISEPARGALIEEWQNIPQEPFKVYASECHSAINAIEANDRYQ
jgi:hypothetical protein